MTKNKELIVVSAECLPNNQYLIIEKYQNHLLDTYKDGDIIECIEKEGELYASKKVSQ